MMKNIGELFNLKISLFFLVILFFVTSNFFAQNNLTIYYFWGSGCPHCAAAEQFIELNISQYKNVKIEKFEVWTFPENAKLFENFSRAHGLVNPGTPTFFVGGYAIVGWDSEHGKGKELDEIIKRCSFGQGCPDSWNITFGGESYTHQKVEQELIIKIPLIGVVDLRASPLFLLALVLGFLDGFNPCAMWVLIYLISMLAMEKDRTKMWLIAGTFLATTAIFYYLILVAWLNVFLFLGYLDITRMIVGVIAVIAGSGSLYNYFTKPHGDACEVVNPKERKKLIDQIKSLTKANFLPLVLASVVVLAITVNMIEFVCSSGFPALFTRVLAENKLSFLEYQFYVLVYLLMFMIDDIMIFAVSVITLSAYIKTGEKYAKLSHLVGSLIMLLLGIMLLFFPKAIIF